MNKVRVLVYLLTAALLVLSTVPQQTRAKLSSTERLLLRRQTDSSSGESEKESTTANNNQGQQQQQQPPPQQAQQGTGTAAAGNNGANQAPRLYPDLAHVPYPSAAAPGPAHFPAGPMPMQPPNFAPTHGQTPFVPFGLQMPTNRLNDLQHRLQPRPVQSPSERLQSQTFTNGLGRRLLSMVGLDSLNNNNNATEGGSNVLSEGGSSNSAEPRQQTSEAETMMRALQNSTVLQQLNRGVQSIYGSLSKMYNSTVQQQLDLLQEKFKREIENSTNPWQQRMAQQVPMFFKTMAMKVEEAQANLNRVWRQVTQANNGTFEKMPQLGGTQQQQPNPQSRSFLGGGGGGPFDQFMGGPPNQVGGDPFQGPNNFFNQIGRSFGFGESQPRDIGSQFINFWHNQVQPQIGMVGNQIARVWRDLTASGVYQIDPMSVRARHNGGGNNLGSAASSPQNESVSSDIVDDILKSVDMTSGSEYSIIEPKSDGQQQQQQPMINTAANNMGAQMQNRLVAMQRDLNQLWHGLSSSIQGALSNVRNTLNPRPQFNGATAGPLDTMASNTNQEVDQTQNEINSKIKDLNKLQRDADIVYDTVQNQQQAQQRASFSDRFKNFIGNVDFGNVDQLPNRIGESVSRFGTAVGDLWNQIPNRWDNFMQNVRPQQQQQPQPQLQQQQQNPTSGRLTAAPASSAGTGTGTGTTAKPIEVVSNLAS